MAKKICVFFMLHNVVYRDKISYFWVSGFPLNDGIKEGYTF